jgi:hypothetical protein
MSNVKFPALEQWRPGQFVIDELIQFLCVSIRELEPVNDLLNALVPE